MVDWWEYPTNYSNGTAIDGVGKFFIKYPSHILNNNFATGFILLLFVSIYGIMLGFGVKKALMVAGFITSIFSVYFSSLGVLNPVVPIVAVIITIIGVIGSKEDRSL